MNYTALKEYNGFKEGQILFEEVAKDGDYKLKLCKGIYTDENGLFYAGFQYIDKRATKRNKKITVSGKSLFWFEKI